MSDEPDTDSVADVAAAAESDGWVDESLEETWPAESQDDAGDDGADSTPADSMDDGALEIAGEVAEDFPEVSEIEPFTDPDGDDEVTATDGLDEGQPTDDEAREVAAVQAGAVADDGADQVAGEMAEDFPEASEGDPPAEALAEPESAQDPAATDEAPDPVPSDADGDPAEQAAEVREPVEATGHAAVDAVLSSLEGLETRPVSEHVAVFERAHAGLRQALDDGHAS